MGRPQVLNEPEDLPVSLPSTSLSGEKLWVAKPVPHQYCRLLIAFGRQRVSLTVGK
jgi:hypothetical protein